ncbi:MAG: acyl-CoA synthetases (AMP-forming)/AMP-acid ligases II [halophilic archaeon J07HB67]|jgi:Acyl-CoA synthetases (AMP-forming)/AMP-acid ligases II|nr:MAG: acyl-CoA synthetases (AMP-forming)/AMP-acid ligases II [halophilic archaeon J07HB67]
MTPEAAVPAAGHANGWVGDWSARRRQLSPDRVGVVDADTGREFSYADLDDRANRAARLCRAHGVEKGDRVAVLSRNRPELVDLFFATGKLGAILAPVSHRLAAPELAAMLSEVVPELLVVEAPFTDLAGDVLAADAFDPDRMPTVVVVSDESDGDDTVADAGWEETLPADDTPVDRPDVALGDPHLFLHTGGSTGVPKETVLAHRSILWNSFNTITAWGLRAADTTPMTFPMFHTGGWNVLTVPLFHLGGTVVIAREFDPGQVLGSVDDRDATVLIAVPAVLRAMADHDGWAETDLSTLRFAKSGGGPCRNTVLESWWDRDVDLSQGYGLTECGPNNFAMPDDWPREKADSVGVPAPHVDARIVDEFGDTLPDGEVGELELSGPHAADRYWQAPEESRRTFGDGEGDRWVATGDLARVDDDGYYYIEGRVKNMFVSGGENVYPPAVEDADRGPPEGVGGGRDRRPGRPVGDGRPRGRRRRRVADTRGAPRVPRRPTRAVQTPALAPVHRRDPHLRPLEDRPRECPGSVRRRVSLGGPDRGHRTLVGVV